QICAPIHDSTRYIWQRETFPWREVLDCTQLTASSTDFSTTTTNSCLEPCSPECRSCATTHRSTSSSPMDMNAQTASTVYLSAIRLDQGFCTTLSPHSSR